MHERMRHVRNLLCAVAAAGLMGSSLTATADILGTTGYQSGSQSFGISLDGATSNVNAGGFAGTWNSGAIVFWCVELTQFFGFGGNYTDYGASLQSGAAFTMLGQLFNEAYGSSASDAQHSAAFQLAIWEIVYDSDLDLGAGGFHITSGNSTTIAIAQEWLAKLGNYADTYDLILLHSASHQDFVTFGKPFEKLKLTVPEPTPFALLAAAMAALLLASRVRRGATRRRRQP